MDYAASEQAGSPSRMPVTIKILIAGGFGVGKTTLVGSLTEIRPLRTEEPLSEPGAPGSPRAPAPDPPRPPEPPPA